MCGIFGFVNASGSKFARAQTVFEELMIVDTLRGLDGSGVAVLPEKKDDIRVYKRGLWGPEFLTTNGYKSVRHLLPSARIAIGHNRAASKSVPSDENAHPFVNRHITLVHNGYINNAYAITPKGFGPEVDSEAAAWAIAEHGAVAGLEKLRGPFALAWYDSEEHSFNLARNEGRELHCVYLKDYKTLFFASEWLMLHLVLTRNDIKLDGKYKFLTPHQHYKFNIDDPREVEKVPFAEPPPVMSHNHGTTWPGAQQGGTNGQTSWSDKNAPSVASPVSVDYRTGRPVIEPSHPARRALPVAGSHIPDLDLLQDRFTRLAKDHHKGACIPTSRKKIRSAYGNLAQKGWRLGQTLMIDIDSYAPYPNQRTHGEIKAHAVAHRDEKGDHRLVLVPCKTEKEFNIAKACRAVYGTLVNIKMDKVTGAYTLVCIIETLIDRGINNNVSHILKLNKKPTEGVKLYPGPNGLIELGDFMARTALGCGCCTGYVNPDHADKMKWKGESPICHICMENPATVEKLWPGEAAKLIVPVDNKDDIAEIASEAILH